MRAILLLAVLGALTPAPAGACPRAGACVLTGASGPGTGDLVSIAAPGARQPGLVGRPVGWTSVDRATMPDRIARLVVERRVGVSALRVYERSHRRIERAHRVPAARSLVGSLLPLPGPTPLARSLKIHEPPEPPELEMPWIWRVLRREVYQRLPHVEEPRYTLTLMPVVVTGTFDTVPGVGFGGDF